MRIIAISDTHGKHYEVNLPPHKPGDILVHAGDITRKGEIATIQNFAHWAKDLPYEHIITIAGNHDFCFQDERRGLAEDILRQNGVTYLFDEAITINGKVFYGSPWQPWFHNWAFNLQRGEEISKKWAQIPVETNILITHGPPGPNLGGTIPQVISGVVTIDEVGCYDLRSRLYALPNLEYHIFGHIHECYGIYNHKLSENTSCVCVNASSLDVQYRCVNAPFILPI